MNPTHHDTELGAQPQAAPRLQPVCTVLVAGHRQSRMLGGAAPRSQARADIEARLTQALDDALGLLEDALAAIPLRDQAWVEAGPQGAKPWTLRVLTGQADGFDAIARRLGAPPRELHVLGVGAGRAPDAASGFASFELEPDSDLAPSAQRVHEIRDELALGLADCLIVFWDGGRADGWAGGSVRLLHRALRQGLLVLRIDRDATMECIGPQAYTPQQRMLLDTDAFPHGSIPRADDPRSAACYARVGAGERRGAAALAVVRTGLQTALLAPAESGSPHQERDDGALYFREKPAALGRHRSAGAAYQILSATLRRDLPRLLQTCRGAAGEWLSMGLRRHPGPAPAAWLESSLCTADRDAPSRDLERAFRWSDVQAGINAGHHRSTNVLLYVLSALAVLFALSGHLAEIHEAAATAHIFSALEAGVLMFIVLGLRRTRRHRWHERWLSHRYMAEQLRAAMLLRPWLALPAWVTADRADEGALTFERWLLRRRLRIAGIARDAVLPCTRPSRLRLLRERAVELFDGQLAYHRNNARELGQMHRVMQAGALAMFSLTLLAVGAEWTLPWLGWGEWGSAVLVTAGLPAVAAALHGLKEKLELERLARQSSRMARDLQRLRRALEQSGSQAAGDDDGERAAACALHLRELVRRGASMMSDEAEAWHALIAVQESEAP